MRVNGQPITALIMHATGLSVGMRGHPVRRLAYNRSWFQRELDGVGGAQCGRSRHEKGSQTGIWNPLLAEDTRFELVRA